MVWSWLGSQKRDEAGEWTGFLDHNVKIEGRLETTGTFRIDSHLTGSLLSDGVLIIGEHALIQGQIEANSVLVSGRVDAVIHAKAKVEIQRNAIVTGEIHSPCLVVEPGAEFTGQFYLIQGDSQSGVPISIPVRSVCEPETQRRETTTV